MINLYFRYTPQLNFSAIPVGPDTDWAYWFNSVPKGAKTGKDNGFSVLFDIESYDYGYYDEGSEGLKVAIVHHLDMPIIRQRAFHVAPGTENQIPVTPTLYTTNPQVSNIYRYIFHSRERRFVGTRNFSGKIRIRDTFNFPLEVAVTSSKLGQERKPILPTPLPL